MSHIFVSGTCQGEKCSVCKEPATHKIGEEIAFDDTDKIRHNLTAYVCCTHFQMVFGGAAVDLCRRNGHE